MDRSHQWNLNTHYHPVFLDAVPSDARTALDVGCGDGLLTFDLAERGLDVVGIDADGPSIERALSSPEVSERTSFVHGDVFTLPFELRSFDVVASSAMLHHVDTERGLRRLRDLVRPGGTLVVVSFAMPSDPLDWALIVAGDVLRRMQVLRGRYWEHDAPVQWPPPLSMKAMRALVERELPGARFHRRMAHRYSVAWTSPRDGDAESRVS